MTQEEFEIQTRRLTGGPVAEALASGDPAGALCRVLLGQLDGGEGWTALDSPTSALWYPHRLGVRVSAESSSGAPAVRIDIPVVQGARPTQELLQALSDLNAHAAGWCWWLDDGVIRCTLASPAMAKDWWWPLVLVGSVPLAVTVAESNADHLVQLSGGELATALHPDRGARPAPDGWLAGVRLGERDPAAAIGHPLLPRESERFRSALAALTHEDAVVDLEENGIFVVDQFGGLVGWRPHWHDQFGFGWQFVTVAARAQDDALRVAHELTAAQARSSGPVLGGWAAVPDVGLVRTTFVPAVAAAQVMAVAGPTVGDVLALMVDVGSAMDVLAQLSPEDGLEVVPDVEAVSGALAVSTVSTGIIGWSYLDEGGQTPYLPEPDGPWTDQLPLQDWTRPRHTVVCTWGIFNPMGPTVGSLEVAWRPSPDGLVAALYHVLRHPFLPRIELLGEVLAADLDDLVHEVLAGEDLLGSGPEWVRIFGSHEHVQSALRNFAAARPETGWEEQAARLIHFALYPWSRLDAGVTHEQGTSTGAPEDAWVQAVTDPVVVLGHSLFLRSAWEGAKAYRDSDWDPQAAQQAADRDRAAIQERYEAAFGRRPAD